MEKVIRDGEIAVLYSPSHGAGWYSWHEKRELLFDPYIVNIILEHREKHPRARVPKSKAKEIIRYCEERYESRVMYAVFDLDVFWVKEGVEFRIDEYDGSETVMLKDEYDWVTA